MDEVAWKRELRECAEHLEDICGLALSIETRAEDVLDQYPDKRLVRIQQDAAQIRALVAGVRARIDPRQGTLWEEEQGGQLQ